jgi:hypothetical protein
MMVARWQGVPFSSVPLDSDHQGIEPVSSEQSGKL